MAQARADDGERRLDADGDGGPVAPAWSTMVIHDTAAEAPVEEKREGSRGERPEEEKNY